MFKAISPKLPLLGNPIPAAEARMRKFGGDSVRAMAKYPPQKPTTYRRTGTLGRNWRYTYQRQVGSLVTIVDNPVPYAPYVQGNRQASFMAGRGWKTVESELQPVWDDAVAAILSLFTDSTH